MDELVKRLRAQADAERYFVGESMLYDVAADAIEELSATISKMEKATRWIPVSERLPDGRDSVLALTGDCDIYVCDYIPSVKQFWTIPGDELHTNDITHWQPLPQPPKEEEA